MSRPSYERKKIYMLIIAITNLTGEPRTRERMLVSSKRILLASIVHFPTHSSNNVLFAKALVPVFELPRYKGQQFYSSRAMSTNLDDTTNDPSVRVVSYNLLSTHLANPSYHTKCDPCNLIATNRLPKILSKLETELTQSADTPVIFCLQEVSHDWASALHVFFAENGYHMVTALYGRHFNGYMGM